jgi:hypothetical protein
VFTGEYRHTVDDKGRIAVPVKFRAQLDPGLDGLGLARRLPGDPPEGVWDDLAAKVAALPITDQRSRLFQRFVFSHAVEAEMDKQGRVLAPGLPARIDRPRRRGRGRRLARSRGDLGTRTGGTPTARRSTTRRSWPRPSRARASSSHHMRFQDPLGIRSSGMEER